MFGASSVWTQPPSWPGPHMGFNVAVQFASPHVLLITAHPGDNQSTRLPGKPADSGRFSPFLGTTPRPSVSPENSRSWLHGTLHAFSLHRTPPRLADIMLWSLPLQQNWITQITTQGNISHLRFIPWTHPLLDQMYHIFVNSHFEIYIYVYMHIHIPTCLQEHH